MFFTSHILGTDSMEIRHGNILSVQESTAKNIHVFSGIDLSSIQESSKREDSNSEAISGKFSNSECFYQIIFIKLLVCLTLSSQTVLFVFSQDGGV